MELKHRHCSFKNTINTENIISPELYVRLTRLKRISALIKN